MSTLGDAIKAAWDAATPSLYTNTDQEQGRVDLAEGIAVPVAAAIAAGGGGGGLTTAGAGLTATGATVNANAHADGSIVVNADDIQVGVLASDAQHGNRGGGSLHADAVAAGASGFMTGAQATKLANLGAAPASSVVVAWTALNANIDLTAEGPIDWYIQAPSTATARFPGFNGARKQGGEDTLGLTFAHVSLGATALAQGSGITISATDSCGVTGGSAGANYSQANFSANGSFTSGTTLVGFGFRMNALAGPTSRRLRVFSTCWSADMQCVATLQDGTTHSVSVVGATSTSSVGYFDITYQAPTWGQIIKVSVLVTVNRTASPNILFRAACLT